MPPALPVLVFDGDCAFCSSSVRWIERRIRRHPTLVPYQFAPLDELGLTAEACRDAVQWVGAGGEIRSANRAIAAMLVAAGSGWRLLGHVIDLPVVRSLAGVVYRWVARNRHRLPGGTPACAVRPSGDAPSVR
jgi:predicted DCC family thiol-disulfide oxidoreductase YuxK